MTMLVQSSSIFTSVLTPLVGMNVIKLECMYPLTLGSNIGTTATGLLAAMAASGDKLEAALQIALVHLFFNITGIILFYPIPHSRIPIRLAKIMGNTTAKYRWFAAFYLLMMFVVLPLLVFGMSLAGSIPLAIFLCITMTIATFAIILNVLQRKIPQRLPQKLRTWDFLPFEWMHSLDPLDRVITKIMQMFKSCCCKPQTVEMPKPEEEALNAADTSGSYRIFTDYSTPSREEKTTELSEKDIEKKLEAATGEKTTKLSEKDIEKKLEAAAENWDVESGYGSRTVSEFPSRVPTPNNSATSTPSQSVLPSRAASVTVLDIKESKL